MLYCKKCVYPFIAVNLEINNDGVCSSCKTFEKFNKLTSQDWLSRKLVFEKIIEKVCKENSSNYDCLIPVSGGKDSYYQTHVIVKKYNLKPLLVTYHGNNFLPEGDYNRDRMREVFNADHIVWGPSIEVLKKLNRLGFEKMGDMNWHAHCGIFTSPIIIAAKFNIPFIIWGEIAWDISGMYQPNDFPEFSARVRHEHMLRGFEWYDFLKNNNEKLSEKDLLWAKYPSDKEILMNKIRGLYIGNYFKWKPNDHYKEMKNFYSWKESKKPFQRTYRKFSNLDDRYESGIHDLMKFIKFGYGRASDHASKDIRDGIMTREKGIKMVKKYDHVISDDLHYWLEYINRDQKYFWKNADKFRDPRVWSIKNNTWYKKDITGDLNSYGKVHLNKLQVEDFVLRKKLLQSKINNKLY